MSYPFLTERIDLPSKGLVYPLDNPLSKGYVDMRYMTAFHEDILTNMNYLSRGIEYTIDKFARGLIVDEKINFDDLVGGDRFQLLIASRILAWGQHYSFEYKGKDYVVDLSQLTDKEIDYTLFKNKNEVPFRLPILDIDITIKLLTHGDFIWIEEETKRLKAIHGEDAKFDTQLKLKRMILSVEGNYEQEYIDNFLENRLVSFDIRHIFSFYREIEPEVNITLDADGGTSFTIPFSYYEMFYDHDSIQKTISTRNK